LNDRSASGVGESVVDELVYLANVVVDRDKLSFFFLPEKRANNATHVLRHLSGSTEESATINPPTMRVHGRPSRRNTPARIANTPAANAAVSTRIPPTV